MFLSTRPTARKVRAFEEAQRAAPLSYTEVGATRHADAPPGYAIDHASFYLGSGEGCFERAKESLKALKLFNAGWIRLQNAAQIQEGQTLVLLIKHLGFYSLIANRIVYLVDEPRAFGFSYGTLTGHAEQGEERFLVRLSDDGAVTFEIFAFSRPVHPLARLGRPIARLLQKRAARAYAGAILRGMGAQV